MIPSSLPITVADLDTGRKQVRKGLSFSICASGYLYVYELITIEAIVLTFGHYPW